MKQQFVLNKIKVMQVDFRLYNLSIINNKCFFPVQKFFCFFENGLESITLHKMNGLVERMNMLLRESHSFRNMN